MISVIVAYYKNLGALEFLLEGYALQSEQDFELIIAEDAQDEKTIEFLEGWENYFQHKIKHVSQPDNGFRKTRILNKAIEVSTGDFIIFTDGDCIPHKHFIRAYKKARKAGYALFGRRVMLGKTISEEPDLGTKLSSIHPISLIGKAKKIKYGLYLPFIQQEREEGIWGCNWGIEKKELLAIDGFDENYMHAGIGEDVDIEWRLKQNGIKLLSIRYGAIVYHIHHEEHYNEVDVNKGYAILNAKKKLSSEQ